ncbi:LOG family protein [Candidatus Jorgensenbacteria bacterium]|nr:LOG family protein [Candidatus Jorgensenbacteria bacterium]
MPPKKTIPPQYHSNHSHKLKYKICVSGAAETGHCAKDALEKAEELGREIARRGLVLVTGATTGIPYWAAKGVKEESGIVIGFSPASSKAQHVRTYHLPLDYHDVIVYTGFEYTGRNLILTRSSDAIIVICGRMGTLNEFTIGFEDQKPVGILEGTGGTADLVSNLLENVHRGPGKVVFSKNPSELLDKLLDMIESEEEKNGVKGRII